MHGIVRGHGGAIRVDSAPGAGTEVRVYLPTIKAPRARKAAKSGPTIPHGNGERIMIIDDDKLVLRTVTVMVEGLGYEVSEWTDPVQALDAFSRQPEHFDAVLTDLTMSAMTGVEFADRAAGIRQDVQVAIMTGNPAAMNGATLRCVGKPIPLSELAMCLNEMVQA